MYRRAFSCKNEATDQCSKQAVNRLEKKNMFINFWYPAEQSKNIGNEPTKLRMLGQDFVLWRDSKDRVHCLSNTCTYRGGSLGGGKVKDDCIQCPYHGWRFDGDGNCTAIPSPGRHNTQGWVLDPIPLLDGSTAELELDKAAGE